MKKIEYSIESKRIEDYFYDRSWTGFKDKSFTIKMAEEYKERFKNLDFRVVEVTRKIIKVIRQDR